MISTNELNNAQKAMALQSIKEYFKELPINITFIDSDNTIANTNTHTEEVGFFSKRIAQVTKTTISYGVYFTYGKDNKMIYLNDEMMRDKESLINNMKFDLGIR